jgi:hypothetical protein
MVPRGVTEEQVVELLTVLRRIPDSARDPTFPAHDAYVKYLVTESMLEYLIAHGLPHRRADGTVYVERTDIMNAALHLDLGISGRAARRFWSASLNRSADEVSYDIDYLARCPVPEEPGHVCHYRMALPGGRHAERVTTDRDPGALATVRVTLRSDWPPLPPEVCELLDVTAGLRFMRLPPTLRYDLDFIRRSGLADCAGTTRLLVAEGRRRGFEVRPSFGYIVVAPFSTAHSWAEVRVADRWVPVDPVLVGTMLGWGVLRQDWTRYRSPGAIFTRVLADSGDLITHNGTGLRWTLPTRPAPTG